MFVPIPFAVQVCAARVLPGPLQDHSFLYRRTWRCCSPCSFCAWVTSPVQFSSVRPYLLFGTLHNRPVFCAGRDCTGNWPDSGWAAPRGADGDAQRCGSDGSIAAAARTEASRSVEHFPARHRCDCTSNEWSTPRHPAPPAARPPARPLALRPLECMHTLLRRLWHLFRIAVCALAVLECIVLRNITLCCVVTRLTGYTSLCCGTVNGVGFQDVVYDVTYPNASQYEARACALPRA